VRRLAKKIDKDVVKETQIENRLYLPGEEITFVNQFSHMALGVVNQDCGRFVTIEVKEIQKNNYWNPLETPYNTTIWKKPT